MTLDPEFVSTLVCPKSHKALRLLEPDELDRLNAAISAGTVEKYAGGGRVETPLEAALRPDGESYVFPVVDGIPIMLVEEAVSLPASESLRNS